jgi:DNA-binding NtrC family response regulator
LGAETAVKPAATAERLKRESFPPESGTGVRPLPLFESRIPYPAGVGARIFGNAVAASQAMLSVFDLLERFSRTDVSVTLLGETGTGKDVLARALHQASKRASGPFVVFDCGSVTASLAESELLGHERGSFTGAIAQHLGAFERADRGTLFLDEIGELPLSLQTRLLRALDGRRIRRVGGRAERTCDVRIVAATNRDLRSEVAAGRFREDLYFRLATAVVSVPPLRDRIDDIEPLVEVLLANLGARDVVASESALDLLRRHRWPGNVRELRNALACAVAFLDEGVSRLEPRHLRLVADGLAGSSELDVLPLGGLPLAQLEKVAICQTLALSQKNKVRAAQALGIAVSTLYEKLKKHGI